MRKPIILTLLFTVASAAVVLAAAPDMPAEFRVSPLGRTSHVLRWNDVAGETGYSIERWNGSSWDAVTPVGADVTSYIDAARPDGALPEYRVSAFNGEGSSPPTPGVTSLRMNVLFFYADDMGFKDVVANRNPATDGPTIYETPNLDTLVSQGVNFTQAYASGPKCVVARRAMQTGMYDFREAAVAKGGGIGNEMITLGEAMKAGGYRTCFLGKWHLGGSLASNIQPHAALDFDTNPTLELTDPNYYEANKIPSAQGYDVAIAAGEWGAPPISYFATTPTGVAGEYWYGLPDLYTTEPGEYLTDRLTFAATGFVSDHVSTHPGDPFFVMLAHYAVHTPLEAKQPDIDYFELKKTAMAADFAAHPAGSSGKIEYSSKVRLFQDQTTYAAMVKSFDESLATIRNYLASTPDPRNPGKMLGETTIIVYSSDHGGKSTHWINSNDSTDIPTSNYPLRQGKTWCYEGGLKVPLVVYWPGIGEAGASSDALINGADFYTTFLDMTGTPRQPTQHLDSISFAETAVDPSVKARDESYHWFTNADVGTGNPALAVYRSGPYKLVHHIIRRTNELYNLDVDVSEANDIASIRPDLVSEMFGRLVTKRDEVGETPSKPTSNSWNQELLVVAPVVAIPPLPDGAPSGFSGNAVSTTSIDLVWADASSNEERFVIERKIVGGGAFVEFTTVPANVSRFRDTGLTPGTSYQYRIQAETLAGWAGPSNQITVATPSVSEGLPVIARGDAISVLKNETRRFDPLANDQGEGLVITGVSAATLGTVTVDGGLIDYIPQFGVSGSEQLSYTVMDSHGATATGIAQITILDDLTVTSPLEYDLSPVAVDLDVWEFNEAGATQFSGLANSAGSAMWSGNDPDATTNGSGSLVFVQGTQSASDNIFRNTDLSTKNVSTGSYELSYTITAATIEGGDTAGANVGFGIRDDSGTDLFIVRLQRQSSALRLEYRTGSTTLLKNFGVTSISDLRIRAVFNLDTDTCDVFWKIGSNPENSMSNLPLGGAGLEADMFRLAANTNATDWGATDHVDVDFLRFRALDQPAIPTPFQVWMDAAEGSVTPSVDKLPLADADADSATNLAEFAFGGDPLDSSSGVVQRTWIGDTAADADALDELVVTLPVRSGCQFQATGSGPVGATVDGLNYQIRGSLDLVDFTEPVDEVFPALESGYPPLAPGWEYHSFRLTSSNGMEQNGFIQGVVEAAP